MPRVLSIDRPRRLSTLCSLAALKGVKFTRMSLRGTDHGHGSVHWILGGAINGGRIAGEQVRVVQSALFQDRDYPVLNDYRAILGGVFQALWGLSAGRLQQIFPGAQALDLQLV